MDSRRLRALIGIGAVLMVVIGLLLLYLLLQATNNRQLYESNYAQLFAINVLVATLLMVAIVWVGYRLFVRLRQGRFGSRLLVKLATIFALVGFAPGLLIYVVSYQFVSRSIETWFDVKVEGALEAGLNLGRVTLETLSNDFTAKTRAAAVQLAESNDPTPSVAMERMVDQLGATELTLWSSNGSALATAGQASFQLSPSKPTPAQFRSARSEKVVTWIEGLEDMRPDSGAAHIRVLVPVANAMVGLSVETRYLQAARALPANLVANALAVETANREYQERALAREGLRRMYIGTLTLSLFLAVFGAMLMAVLLGNQIARPLLLLTEGVSQVAAGDLTPKIALQGKDELGGLTRAFASMTQQLADARQTVQASMQEVDASRANLQTILDNLTSGVIVLDAHGLIRSSNPGAARILQLPLALHLGESLAALPGLQGFGEKVQSAFGDFLHHKTEHGADHWQDSFALGVTDNAFQSNQDKQTTLVARGAMLPGNDRLLVFDDISDIVSAQRAQAWGEVARRLAHEIKNPLTPIQLSAERLELRLGGKLEAHEQAILTKSVKTIVDQVDAMKRLVNEFRDFGRLPAAELKNLDINVLVRDVLQLYEEAAAKGAVRLELDPECPMVLGDAQQLRQVIHNLLQNAQDATDSAPVQSDESGNPLAKEVVIRTQWQSTSGRVRLSVLDRGAGFPDNILKRAFEPYVTTKAKGTGLGLAVVKKIADEHAARVDIANRVLTGRVVGAQVSLSLGVDKSAQT